MRLRLRLPLPLQLPLQQKEGRRELVESRGCGVEKVQKENQVGGLYEFKCKLISRFALG